MKVFPLDLQIYGESNFVGYNGVSTTNDSPAWLQFRKDWWSKSLQIKPIKSQFPALDESDYFFGNNPHPWNRSSNGSYRYQCKGSSANWLAR